MSNLVPTAGLGVITGRIKGSNANEPKFVAWGTGTSGPTATDTALGTESAESRTSGTSSLVTTTVANDTYQVVGQITASATRSITESALLDASTSGNMLVRGVFTAIGLASGDAIEFTWQVEFEAA